MSDRPRTRNPCTVDEAVRAIDEFVTQVRLPLVDLALRFSEARGSEFDTMPIESAVLDRLARELEPGCLDVLAQSEPRLIVGIGLVWIGGCDASGMLWWRADNRVIARKQHIYNPDSDSFYDYRNSIWYQGALGARDLVVVGPYVDAWGTDDHALTVSMRMEGDSGLLGVVAVDLNVQTLTDEVEKLLGLLPDSVLLGIEDRVVASNMALLSPGLRLQPFLAKTGKVVIGRAATAIEGWELLQLGTETRVSGESGGAAPVSLDP